MTDFRTSLLFSAQQQLLSQTCSSLTHTPWKKKKSSFLCKFDYALMRQKDHFSEYLVLSEPVFWGLLLADCRTKGEFLSHELYQCKLNEKNSSRSRGQALRHVETFTDGLYPPDNLPVFSGLDLSSSSASNSSFSLIKVKTKKEQQRKHHHTAFIPKSNISHEKDVSMD